MLFMITQVHTAEACPKDAGGADTLINKNAKGLSVKGRWGAWSHHTIWYLAEADSLDAIQKFLDPGMKRCTCTVVPVTESPIKDDTVEAIPESASLSGPGGCARPQ